VAAPALSTILAPSATLAEALSTATLVHGPAWRTLVDRFPGVEGLYVGPDGIPQYSQGLGERLQLCAEGE
jgi:thiamine biosynthesis lipoprotein ApbE